MAKEKNYILLIKNQVSEDIYLLLTERKGRTGKYRPEIVAERTERSEVRTKTTEGQYFTVRLELARLVDYYMTIAGFREQDEYTTSLPFSVLTGPCLVKTPRENAVR